MIQQCCFYVYTPKNYNQGLKEVPAVPCSLAAFPVHFNPLLSIFHWNLQAVPESSTYLLNIITASKLQGTISAVN